MPATTVTAGLSYSEDQCNAVDVLLSDNTKQVFVVQVLNSQIGYNDTGASKIVNTTRITIADGYRAFVAQDDTPFDGYLYPCVRQLSPAETKILANGQLSTNMFLVGPILFPYTYNGNSYGLDPLATFQPSISGNSNQQMYVQLFGVGLPTTTNLYAVKQIVLTGKGILPGLSYKVLIEAAQLNLSGV